MLLVKRQSFELSSSARLVKAADVQTVCFGDWLIVV